MSAGGPGGKGEGRRGRRGVAVQSRAGVFGARAVRLRFFFFQAEDGIRDLTVTGVQTCALPILTVHGMFFHSASTSAVLSASVSTSAFLPVSAPVSSKSLPDATRSSPNRASGDRKSVV